MTEILPNSFDVIVHQFTTVNKLESSLSFYRVRARDQNYAEKFTSRAAFSISWTLAWFVGVKQRLEIPVSPQSIGNISGLPVRTHSAKK